jgi:hypothetical protein
MVSMDHANNKKEALSYRGPDLRLFIRDVRDLQRKKRPITVRSWATIKDVKDIIQQSMQVPTYAQSLYFGPLLTSGGELKNHRTLHDCGIYRSGETILLDIKGKAGSSSSLYSFQSSSGNDICISSSMMDSTPRDLRMLVQEARRGFALGLKPEFVLEGSGGSYFLHDARKTTIAVFKPADEEPYAENNPRGYIPQPGQTMSLRDGVVPGEACIREVAAYLLDHGGVSGVPMTTLAEARHPAFSCNGVRLNCAQGGGAIGAHSITVNSPTKSPLMKKAGSFQEFIRCECTMDDISPSKLSVQEVHKIAILDIRILNADRNAANLLVRRRRDNSLELVPIDHGYCLRSVSDVSWMDWCWLDWPQLKEPLSEELRKYVLDLDIEADARMLTERLNICQEAVDFFRASSSLLKAGVKAGLTLYEIAVMCCRNDNLAEVPSMLEKLIDMASDLAHVAIENERWDHTAASRALVEQLSPRHRRRSSMVSMAARSSTASSRSSKSFQDSEDMQTLRNETGAERPSELTKALARRNSPALVQSSASDSSTGEVEADGNCEKDECEEWAASVIMDVSVDQLVPTHRGARSGSIISDDASSDSGLSSSPKGFWHVRPGASFHGDDGSINWSVHGSPRNSVAFLGSECSEPAAANLDDSQDFKSPTVSFSAFVIAPGPYLPPKTVSVSKFGSFDDNDFPMLHRTDSAASSGMSRSKSYSALPATGTSRRSSINRAAKEMTEDNVENYRKYFLKFIDLVIVREMTVATHNSKHGD